MWPATASDGASLDVFAHVVDYGPSNVTLWADRHRPKYTDIQDSGVVIQRTLTLSAVPMSCMLAPQLGTHGTPPLGLARVPAGNNMQQLMDQSHRVR